MFTNVAEDFILTKRIATGDENYPIIGQPRALQQLV